MSTPKEIFEVELAGRLAGNPDKVKGINATYQFVITGEGAGTWAIRIGAGGAEVIPGGVEPANITITMKDDDFIGLMKGTVNAQMAFMMGKIKVVGDIGLAMRLQQILS